MPTTIKLKNSVTTTNAPSSLVQGEVAINITDKKVWVGNAATTPVQLLGDGGSASFTSIAFGAGTVSNPSITFTGDTNTGIYSPAADTIAFTEGGVESMRIDSSGNVGIGTNSPATKLQISQSGAGPTVTLNRLGDTSGNAVIRSTGSTGTINASITLGGGSDNLMTFATGSTAAERMRIDSSGNVGIGTSSPSYPLHVSGASDCILFLTATNSNASGQYIANGNGAGSYPAYNLYQSGVNYWSVMMRADTNLYFQRQGGSGNTILTNGTFKTPSTISVGNATPSTSGAGITFPATQSASSDANTLDDYEEGTWTPVLRFNGSSTGITYVARYATYTKVGRVVTVIFYFQLGSKGSATGQAEISGFPFAFGSGISDVFNLMPARGYINTGGEDLYCYTSGNSTVGLLYQGVNDGTANGAVTQGAIANNSEFEASFSYFVS